MDVNAVGGDDRVQHPFRAPASLPSRYRPERGRLRLHFSHTHYSLLMQRSRTMLFDRQSAVRNCRPRDRRSSIELWQIPESQSQKMRKPRASVAAISMTLRFGSEDSAEPGTIAIGPGEAICADAILAKKLRSVSQICLACRRSAFSL